MPSSKSKAESQTGRALVQGAKAPGARASKRAAAKAAPKPTQGAQNERMVRQPGQDPSAYTASTWGTSPTFEVTVPSGQTCLVRELSVERLIEMGLLQAINSLESIVGHQVLPKAQGQKPAEVDMAKLLQSGDQLTSVLALVNTIICEAVVAPKVYPVPEGDEERIEGRVYVDSIGMGDRFALFAEVTGNLENLTSFR